MVETHRELGDEIKAVIVGGYIDARLLNAQILFEWHMALAIQQRLVFRKKLLREYFFRHRINTSATRK